MYKAIGGLSSKSKIYLATETFPKTAKKVSSVYKSGIRVFNTNEMKTYSLVIYRLRFMLGIKHRDIGATNADQ